MTNVSVVVPAYNAGTTVRATVESVLAQSYNDFEVILVDDGSTDDTAEIVDAIGSPVRCVRTENAGVSAARNRGVAESTGRYIAFLDADDLWMPEKLSYQVAVLDDDASAGGCYVGVVKVDEQLRELSRMPAEPFEDLCRSLLLHSSVIPSSPSSLMVRREVHEAVGGFDRRFSQCADWDYLLKLSLSTRLRPIPEYLAMYRKGSANMSRDIGLLERDTFAVLDRFFSDDAPDRYLGLRDQCYSNHWMILSGSYLHAGQLAASVRCLVKGLRLWPRNVVRPLWLPVRQAQRILQAGQRRKRVLA